MRDRIVIMGAGGLSCGFFGPELRSEYDLTFLDVKFKADFIGAIQKTGAYTVNIAGKEIVPTQVKDVEAFLIDDPAQDAAIRDRIRQARVFFTAVGIRNFESAAGYLVERLKDRKDNVYILCAENGEGVTESWRNRTPENVHFLDTVMGRMCRLEEHPAPLYVPAAPGIAWGIVAEEFYGMPLSNREYDATAFHSDAFQFVSEAEFHARDRVKLFAHNGLHCCLAVQGRLRGVQYFCDLAGTDAEAAARELLNKEIAPALWKECGPHLDRAYLERYFAVLPGRLVSPTLRDSASRGVRGLVDKFSANERIIGGLNLLLRNGVKPDRFLSFIANALEVVRQDSGEEAAAKALANVADPALRQEIQRRRPK